MEPGIQTRELPRLIRDKQDKESSRNHISSAGTIGRKFYDDSSHPSRNARDDYGDARGQQDNSHYVANRSQDRERGSRYADSYDDYDTQRYRGSYSNALANTGLSGHREPFNDMGLRPQLANNEGSKFVSASHSVSKPRSTGFGVGLDDPERNNVKSSYSATKNNNYFDDAADVRQNVAPRMADEEISPFKSYSRDVRERHVDDEHVTCFDGSEAKRPDERPARRYEDTDGYMPAPHHFSNTNKNCRPNNSLAQDTQRNYNENVYRPARTPPPTVGKKVANIVWDEEEGDNVGEEEEVSTKKRLPATQQLKTRYDDDSDDESSDEQQKPKPQNTQVWTRRDASGEFTDEDSTDDDDEKNGTEKAANSRNLTSLSSFNSAAKSAAAPLKPQNSSSSSSESTLFDHPQKAGLINVAERKETPSPKPFNRVAGLTSSVPANGDSIGGVRVPASHGEKWLFELKRQEAERASRKPQRPVTPSSSSENERDDVFRSVAPTAKNQTSASVAGGVSSAESQPLRRPIPLKPNVERSPTSSVLNGGSNTPNDSSSIIHPLRRTGSTVSMMSTLTARRWNRALNEEDLGKLDDLIAAMEMIEPRFSTLEQMSGYEYTDFLSKFCKKIEVIGRCGNYNLLWREADQKT